METKLKQDLDSLALMYLKQYTGYINSKTEYRGMDEDGFADVDYYNFASTIALDGYKSTLKYISYDLHKKINNQEGSPFNHFKKEDIEPSSEYLELLLAKNFAKLAHKDQKRADGSPYIGHVEEVAAAFESDYYSQTLAWLHDVVEDCPITLNELKEHFSSNVVEGVRILTRNLGRKEYKFRLLGATKKVQKVKLADMKHNCTSMALLDHERYEELISRKVADAFEFYIPLAIRINELDYAKELMDAVAPYEDRYTLMHR